MEPRGGSGATQLSWLVLKIKQDCHAHFRVTNITTREAGDTDRRDASFMGGDPMELDGNGQEPHPEQGRNKKPPTQTGGGIADDTSLRYQLYKEDPFKEDSHNMVVRPGGLTSDLLSLQGTLDE